ncbi:unnamed protein product [Vitrella brassicaformis CCMP3155]|uniref:Uncharacterized protein n=1 Tax=Vitrella brassicaformis (strain CCMP3155) TaxID=1169540 RepID=A0A0G4E8Y9_VITBC|nr:unnamed protein product [Vitrella brassicaformis CCMP3155]|eukprot:CEL92370.1 unnamed protein product [Vitrella brassicaformis CCMP3155]
MSEQQLHGLIGVLVQRVRSANCTKLDKQVYIQCVATVCRHVGPRIGSHLTDIGPLFLSDEDTAMDGGDKEAVHEMLESCLTAIESLVIKCTQQMRPYLHKLLHKSLALALYDPHAYWPDEDDDSSWRVRSAALQVVSALT